MNFIIAFVLLLSVICATIILAALALKQRR